jgi:hypothetical protein
MAAVLGQWQAGQSIPVWSTAQQFGYGSPMPALYHKTHLYVSTAVLGLTGSVKAAMVLPLYLLMVVGFCGMCFCLRQALVGRHFWLWPLGGATLLLSNYATTDWLVRGAFAEFAALMLIPWVFAWCLILINEGRWAIWIGPLMALLALSHAALAIFALLPLALACGLGVVRWRGLTSRWFKPALLGGFGGLLLMLPFLLPMLAASRFNRVDRLTMLAPRDKMAPWERYLWDAEWSWWQRWDSLTVQLDTMLLLLCAVYIATLVWPRKHAGLPSGARVNWTAMLLLGTLAVMAWLQLPQSAWFYERMPGTRYVQFPWRLLAYLTVVLIVCACLGLSRLCLLGSSRWGVAGRVAAIAGGLLLLVWISAPKLDSNWTRYDWISGPALEALSRKGEDYTAFGEFLPLVSWPPAGNGLGDATAQMSSWLHQIPPEACQLTPIDNQATERQKGVWAVNCADGSEVHLPVFMAPGMGAEVRRSNQESWQEIPFTRTCADPRLKVVLPEGQSQVQIRFPNWTRMAAAFFSRQNFDYRRDCVFAAS